MTATEKKLMEVLQQGLRIRVDPGQPLRPEMAIFGPDGLGLDSVDVLEVAVLLDKNFGVQLPDHDDQVQAALASIGSLARYIDTHRQHAEE